MLAIRLSRTGSKKRPYFRVVVTGFDAGARQPVRRDPRALQPEDQARDRSKSTTSGVAHWLAQGARPSDTVRTLLARPRDEQAGRRAPRRRRRPRPRRPAAVSEAREVVEFLARALVDDPDAVRVTEAEQHGTRGDRVVRGARRSRQGHRAAGADGRGAADAGGRRRRAARAEGHARDPRAGPAGPAARPMTAGWDDDGAGGPDRPGARHPRRGHRESRDRLSRSAGSAPGAELFTRREGAVVFRCASRRRGCSAVARSSASTASAR